MTDIISRLLDEAEKAQRKGHLPLAEVCRDASDKIGLLAHELADMTSDYLRRHKDACDRMVEIERLRADLLKAEMRAEVAGLENIMRAVAKGRQEGIEAAMRVCDERMNAYRAGTPTGETMAAIEEIADLLVAIRALLTEAGR